MTPPITDSLFTKPCMECVECHGKAPSPFLVPLCVEGPVIEEGALFRIGHQAGHAHGHLTETDSTTEAPLEEHVEWRGQVHLPICFLCHSLTLRNFDLIAVADREGKTPAYTPLTPQRAAEPLQDIE